MALGDPEINLTGNTNLSDSRRPSPRTGQVNNVSSNFGVDLPALGKLGDQVTNLIKGLKGLRTEMGSFGSGGGNKFLDFVKKSAESMTGFDKATSAARTLMMGNAGTGTAAPATPAAKLHEHVNNLYGDTPNKSTTTPPPTKAQVQPQAQPPVQTKAQPTAQPQAPPTAQPKTTTAAPTKASAQAQPQTVTTTKAATPVSSEAIKPETVWNGPKAASFKDIAAPSIKAPPSGDGSNPPLPFSPSSSSSAFSPSNGEPTTSTNSGGPNPGQATESAGDKITKVAGSLIDDANSLNPIQMAMGAISKAPELLGAIGGAGVQYAYNRISGPSGNQNAALQFDQSMGPGATMMGISVPDYMKGLSLRTPAQGTYSDILGATLAGQSVGAFLGKTPQRNGYFESVRQMQTLTPGIGAAQISQGLTGYMENTHAQQMGTYYGGGAFTMIGQDGRYKSLEEWAIGITKFLEQQRPGGDRGKPFSSADLMAQNFPGSNLNAWFQMMSVPDNMVGYWWQYAMTRANAGRSGDSASLDLPATVKAQRGQDLAATNLLGQTSGARRDFLLGTQMHPLYNANLEANNRFNVAMQGADLSIGQTARTTNAGALFSLIPTPLQDILAPLLIKLASSPFGGVANSLSSMLQGNLTTLNGQQTSKIGTNDSIVPGSPGPPGSNAAIPGSFDVLSLPAITNHLTKDLPSSNAPPSSLGRGLTGPQLGQGLVGPNPGQGYASSLPGQGDTLIGDTGYGSQGTTDSSHMSPDLARRVKAMQRANPRLRVSSGYRDTVTQNRLHSAGVGRVGPAGKSAHTRGWAADLGPSSEFGWLQANARKFGLQTAANQGEPWHVQTAGTMPMGDYNHRLTHAGDAPIGDEFIGDGWGWAKDLWHGAQDTWNTGTDIAHYALHPSEIPGAIEGWAQGALKGVSDTLLDPITNFINNFISGGTAANLVDKGIQAYMTMVTQSFSNLSSLFGKFDTQGLDSLSTTATPVHVTVSNWSGFSPQDNLSGANVFGDIPIGDAGAYGGNRGGVASLVMQPTVVHYHVNFPSGPAAQNADLKRMAQQLVRHMDTETQRLARAKH